MYHATDKKVEIYTTRNCKCNRPVEVCQSCKIDWIPPAIGKISSTTQQANICAQYPLPSVPRNWIQSKPFQNRNHDLGLEWKHILANTLKPT